MMKFYQENKINPFSSCLPLVAQIPVLIALFYMLRKSLRDDICHSYQVAKQHAYALAHPHIAHATISGMTWPCQGRGGSSFLFIHDLTNQASGVPLIVLLVLYVGTQMGSQVIMSPPTMDQNQRRMMLLLPLVFVAFVFRFPAGVLVYWVTANTWMLGQQFIFKQRIARQRPPLVADGAAAVAVGNGATAAKTAAPKRSGGATRADDASDGAAQGGTLGGLLRGRAKQEPEPAAAPAQRAAPPPSPRKKKKRSGRRR
jgi:YidC/Oxa1 family membrane protein insertase